MAMKTKTGQRGVSLIGLLFVGGILAVCGVVVAQVIPTLIELQAVHKAAKKAAAEGNNVAEVKAVFDRAAQIDDIKSITGQDLVVTKQGDKVTVSYAYQREIHLGGPAWLTLKYEGSAYAK